MYKPQFFQVLLSVIQFALFKICTAVRVLYCICMYFEGTVMAKVACLKSGTEAVCLGRGLPV